MCVRCVWKSPRRHARRQPGIALCFDGLGQRHECGAVLAASCAARGAASVNPRNRRSGASMSASTWRSAGPSVPISMSASGIGLSHVRGQARSGATSTGRAVLRRGGAPARKVSPALGQCRGGDSERPQKNRAAPGAPPVPVGMGRESQKRASCRASLGPERHHLGTAGGDAVEPVRQHLERLPHRR